MAKNPLFSTYRTGENRVTASMLAVFERIDASILERLLAGSSEESSLTFVKFANQPAEVEGTVPDAEISASFHYIFEVKTEPNALRGNQLDGHLLRFAGTTYKDERLIVITPDPEQPPIISERTGQPITWFSFARLNQAIEELLDDRTELVSEQARFLLRELQALFEHEGLLDWPDTVIVAARVAYPEYIRHSAYVCQSGRSFRSGLERMGFYANGAIQREVPRIIEQRDQVVFSAETAASYNASGEESERAIGALIAELLNDSPRLAGEAYGVFLLSPREDERTLLLPTEIRNTTRDRSGKPWAWTLGQRYTSAAALTSGAATTDELSAAGG